MFSCIGDMAKAGKAGAARGAAVRWEEESAALPIVAADQWGGPLGSVSGVGAARAGETGSSITKGG
jgi:hypothetical protein